MNVRQFFSLGSLIVVLLASFAHVAPTFAAVDKLPNLRMAITNVHLARESGQLRLRFSTIIANVGSGRFDVLGRRASTRQPTMDTVKQVIYNDAGGFRVVGTTAVMYFAGDGHNHWHIRDLERFELFRRNANGTWTKVGNGEKHGFCFYDNYQFNLRLPGAPRSPVYRGCGTSTSLSVRSGLSIGWGDRYSSTLPDQYINMTGVPNGVYLLKATANWYKKFVESNLNDNSTSIKFQLRNGVLTIL
jgi:hypothetical protein